MPGCVILRKKVNFVQDEVLLIHCTLEQYWIIE